MFGHTLMREEVDLPGGCRFQPMSLAATIIIAAPTSAFLRLSMGVGPEWAFSPSISITMPRVKYPPVTMPSGMSFASSSGPCSMCSSK